MKTLTGFLILFVALMILPVLGFAVGHENLNFNMDMKQWTQISSDRSADAGSTAFVPVGQDEKDWKERLIYSSLPMKKIMTSEMLYEIFTADFKEDPSKCSILEKEEKAILFQCVGAEVTEIRRVILGKDIIHTLRYTYRILITDQRRSEMIEKLKSAKISFQDSK